MSRLGRPWDDWTPGVLSRLQVQRLVRDGFLRLEAPQERVGVSSIDLTLATDVYHLPDGAIKPSGPRYLRDLREFGKPLAPMDEEGMILEERQTYLVGIRERLVDLKDSGIYG